MGRSVTPPARRHARPFRLVDGIERIFNERLVPDQAVGTKLFLSVRSEDSHALCADRVPPAREATVLCLRGETRRTVASAASSASGTSWNCRPRRVSAAYGSRASGGEVVLARAPRCRSQRRWARTGER